MPADGTAAPRLWSPAAGDGRLDRRDLWRLALVGLLALALGLLGVETLEFYRHTEADRTLIGWEMLERGDFLVPHLLGSIILTKPPLFYWLMAAGIKLSGQATEGVARLPSVLAGVLLALVQYTAVRRAGGTRQVAVLFALVLSSGAAFLIDIQRAEIEMVFGFFSAAALYSLYFSMEERSASLTVAGYLFLALAFLTKGPPILFFLLVTAAFFALWLRFRRRPESGRMTGGGRRLVAAHLMGAGMALALAGGWLLALAHRVGWPALVEQVNVELVQRVVADSARGRGWLFYPWRFSGTLMPWTPFLLAGLALPFFQRRGWAPYRERAGAGWPFFIFNLTVVLSGFLVVSLSQGKSSRYLFPVYASASMLAGFALLWLRGSRLLHRILGMASLLALLAPLPLLAAAATLSLEGVAHSRMILAAVLLSFALVGFGLTLLSRRAGRIMVAFALLLVAARGGETLVYSPHLNARHSIGGVAAALDSALPPGAPLLAAGWFQRSVAYYLKRRGRQVRMFPGNREGKKVAAMNRSGSLYIAYQEPAPPGVQELLAAGASLRTLARVDGLKSPLVLVEIRPEVPFPSQR